MINISIADNQPVVLQGIKCFFKNHAAISVIDCILFLKDLDYSLQNASINILVIDIEFEGIYSVNSLKKIVQNNPNTKLLIYTRASEKLFGITSLKAGAAGFISKNEPLHKVEEAILKIAEGKTVFNDSIHKSFLTALKVNNEDGMYRKLSVRETEVLGFLVNGKKNFEISELLSLNEKTVSTYKLRLLNKLHVTNLIDLVSKAKSLEIV
jgi:DNA-binding NarL/FixJ family response regulator